MGSNFGEHPWRQRLPLHKPSASEISSWMLARENCARKTCTSYSARDHCVCSRPLSSIRATRSEEHTSELQSLTNLVCRLLLEKKKNKSATDNSPCIRYSR